MSTENVWRAFATDLRRFVARRVPADAVDDVVQDIFLRVHDRLDQVRDEERLGAWVFAVARSVIADRGARRRVVEPEPAPVDEPDTEGDPRGSLARWLVAATAELAPSYRQAIELVELEGMTHREAAERLGLSVSGVKSRVQRGRAMLGDKLRRCCHVELDATGQVMDFHRRRDHCCDAC